MKRWLHHLQLLGETCCRHSDETREAAIGKQQSLLSGDYIDCVCACVCTFVPDGFINDLE